MNKFFCLFVLSSIFQNCSLQNQEQQNQGLVYQIEKINLTKEIPFRFKEIVCKEDSGRVKITTELENPTSDSMTITLVDWELETPEGTRSLAIRVSSPSLEIKGNTSVKFNFLFEPTNSLKLFRETGLKGTLLQSYQLLYKGKSIIDFKASVADYSTYKKNKKEPTVFSLSMNDDFKEKELTYLKTTLGLEKNGVEIHEQEILIDGVNFLFNAYHYNDTLVVKVKVVNHSLFPVKMNPEDITVQVDGKNISSITKQETKEITIPRSQRGYIERWYLTNRSYFDHFSINVLSISFMTEKSVPVFYSNSIFLKRNQSTF